ncbi:MAG: BamA/TamA family outer membrane protein [Bacteroidota bacterium]
MAQWFTCFLRNYRRAGLLGAVVLLSACNNIKYLPPNDDLYVGHKLKIESDYKVKNEKKVESELEDVIKPQPTSSILGLRPQLSIYNHVAEPNKETGFKHWLKYSAGKPPVLFSRVNVQQVETLIQNRLYNMGFFDVKVKSEEHRKNRKVSMKYTVTVKKRYVIKELKWNKNGDSLDYDIWKYTAEKSIVKPGDFYDLETLKQERTRIDARLKNYGYYYFDPDYLVFKADSNLKTAEVSLSIFHKKDMPDKALLRYKVNKIVINTNYKIPGDTAHVKYYMPDTVKGKHFWHISNNSVFRAKVIKRSIFLKHNDFYSREKHNLSLNRLSGLGTFKYVNIRLKSLDSTGDQGLLDAYVSLSPMRKKTITGEFSGVTKSNNFAGPAVRLTFKDRNLSHGAEQLIVNLSAGFETVISGPTKGLNSYQLGGDISLNFPKFVLPWKARNSKLYTPKTFIKTGYQLQNRVNFFFLNSFNFQFGYNWSENANIQHTLIPININYVSVSQQSDSFKRLLTGNPLLRRSFEQQFILGTQYSYTYSNQSQTYRQNNMYFNANLDLSGNMIYAAHRTFGAPKDSTGSYTLFKKPYSQYTRLDADYRFYHKITETSMLAMRAYGGYGISYGNSVTMPYVKQFFSGGNNSIRAFQARSIGPGSYRSPDLNNGFSYFDQTGDIKLEANIEYRFDLAFTFLKGAVFLDAGNVWLARPDSSRPGANFQAAKFMSQMAIGTGFGVRVDVSFFVLRLDLGVPLRIPYNPEGDKWIKSLPGFGSSDPNKQNLVLNIAIGYPF